MIDLHRRTPGERGAYIEGYVAGARAGAEALRLVAEATTAALEQIQTDVARLLVFNDPGREKQ
jgi:hypothetical protein